MLYFFTFDHLSYINLLLNTGESSVVIQNRDTNCEIPRDSNFLSGSYDIQATFSYKDYNDSTRCSTLLNPDILLPLSYSTFRNTLSSFEIDTRTFIVSLAVCH